LFVFTLIVLAYISIPLIALACGGGGGGGGGGNSNANSNSNSNSDANAAATRKEQVLRAQQLRIEAQQISQSIRKIPVASLSISDKQTIVLLQNSTKAGLQFTDVLGHPVNLNLLTKGERFQIKIGAKSLIAQFLGNNTAKVALPSGQPVIIQFGPRPAVV
jgi:hypothetical protein